MAQQQCEVAIPGSASPGQTFTAMTPDGQQMVVEVPPGADPGSKVIFLYTPKESVGNQPVAAVVSQSDVEQPVSQTPRESLGNQPVATVVSQSDVEQPVSQTPRESLGNQPVATVVSQSDVQQPVSGGAPELDASRDDGEASRTLWVLYAFGWFFCFCCGPVGLIFWCVAACTFFMKPNHVKNSHPQERTAATINCVTCGLCTCCCSAFIIIIIVVLASTSVTAADDDDITSYPWADYYDSTSYSGCYYTECYYWDEVYDGCCTCTYASGTYYGRRRDPYCYWR